MTVKLSIPASLLITGTGSVGRQTIGSLGSSEDSTTGSLKKPTFSERHPKAIRSITVIGYLFCVSLAAILLSAYYVVFWKPAERDPQKGSVFGNGTAPCRTVAENGGVAYSHTHPYQRWSPNKRMKSPLLVYVPSGASQPNLANFRGHRPKSLDSSSLELDYSNNNNNNANTNNNKSLHQNNATRASVAQVRNVALNSRTLNFAETPEEFPTGASESVEYDVAESTLEPSPSPSPNSIIIQKLRYATKNFIQPQKKREFYA